MRIGILGGTFDPPHFGHLKLAQTAIEALELDEVILVPAQRNPLKKGKRQASARDRLAMVRLLIESEPKMSVSDIEIARGGPSYMVETLEELQYVRPGEYWLLMGSDTALGFDSWKQPGKILKICRIGLAVRPPENAETLLNRLGERLREAVDLIPMPPLDISASEIRLRVDSKRPVHGQLPPNVLQYIRDHKLYEN